MEEREFVDKKTDSAEFNISSKGLWSGKVKVYAETIEEAFSTAHARAQTMEKIIKNKNNPTP